MALGGGSRTELQLARRVSRCARLATTLGRDRTAFRSHSVVLAALRTTIPSILSTIRGSRGRYAEKDGFIHLHISYIHVHLSVSSGNKTLAIHVLTHRRCTRDHPVSCKLYSWGHPTQHTRTSHVHCHSIPNTCPTTLSVRTHSSSRVQLGLKLGVEIGHICLLQH